MKGSPILATALACLIMLGMYVGMRVTFANENQPSPAPANEVSDHVTTKQVSAYVEIYFSVTPKSFSLTHPATGNTLIKVDDINPTEFGAEWSGDVTIPVASLTGTEIEIQGTAEWNSPPEHYQFMQVIISPDDLDAQSRTLRSEFDINDIMKFHWKEDE